jgi:hypothetical protein
MPDLGELGLDTGAVGIRSSAGPISLGFSRRTQENWVLKYFLKTLLMVINNNNNKNNNNNNNNNNF